jgi:hypothetical protein
MECKNIPDDEKVDCLKKIKKRIDKNEFLSSYVSDPLECTVVNELFEAWSIENSILQLYRKNEIQRAIPHNYVPNIKRTNNRFYNNKLKELVKNKCKEIYGVSCEFGIDYNSFYVNVKL